LVSSQHTKYFFSSLKLTCTLYFNPFAQKKFAGADSPPPQWCWVGSVDPSTQWYPSSQSSHAAHPGVAEYFPTSHSAQAKLPATADFPAGQSEQVWAAPNEARLCAFLMKKDKNKTS